MMRGSLFVVLMGLTIRSLLFLHLNLTLCFRSTGGVVEMDKYYDGHDQNSLLASNELKCVCGDAVYSYKQVFVD